MRPPEKQMLAIAQYKVLAATKWLGSIELQCIAELRQLNEWKKTKQLFSVFYEDEEWYPAYAFDDTMRPLPGLQKLLSLFSETKDDWGLAYWFASANSFLGGQRPQDILRTHSHDVLLAGKDELAGITHG